MPKKPTVDDGRFGDLIRSLTRLEQRLFKANPTDDCIHTLREAKIWLLEYVEPWMCPDCGWLAKVPDSDAAPRSCPRCGAARAFPYSYLEAERMSQQINLLVQCVGHYAKKSNGGVAKATLRKVGDVQLTGQYRSPPHIAVPAAETATYGTRSKTWNSWFTLLKFWNR